MASLDFPDPAVTPAFMPANSVAYTWNGTLWLGTRLAISAAASTPTIAFRAHTSTGYGLSTNTDLTAPAGLANGDILIAVILVARGSAPGAVTPPAGFSLIGTTVSISGSGLFVDTYMFWKRAASESGGYTFTHINQSRQGCLMAYSGCLASGTPIGATSNNNGTGGTATGTGITTTAANSYLLWASHDYEGTGTLSPPAGMTERFDSLLYTADQLIATASATGNRTQTNANLSALPWVVRMVELLAA